MTYGTKNFSLKRDPKLQCACGNPECTKTIFEQVYLNELQKARDISGVPYIITSGGRCANHPKEIVKPKPGDHFHGYAVDILADDVFKMYKIVAGLIKVNCPVILVYENFIHAAWRPISYKVFKAYANSNN